MLSAICPAGCLFYTGLIIRLQASNPHSKLDTILVVQYRFHLLSELASFHLIDTIEVKGINVWGRNQYGGDQNMPPHKPEYIDSPAVRRGEGEGVID